MNYERRNKRARYLPYERLFHNYREWRESAYLSHKVDYVRDGEIDGLERVSRMHCFSDSELRQDPAQPRYEGWKQNKAALERKAPDDPSPANCVVNRYNSLLVSSTSEDRSTWVKIVCRPALEECTATFIAARRPVEVDLSYHDLQLWRQVVEPIRATVDSFLVNGADERARPMPNNALERAREE